MFELTHGMHNGCIYIISKGSDKGKRCKEKCTNN